jgi:hypothetical protein
MYLYKAPSLKSILITTRHIITYQIILLQTKHLQLAPYLFSHILARYSSTLIHSPIKQSLHMLLIHVFLVIICLNVLLSHTLPLWFPHHEVHNVLSMFSDILKLAQDYIHLCIISCSHQFVYHCPHLLLILHQLHLLLSRSSRHIL